jgi:hypothetical protein
MKRIQDRPWSKFWTLDDYDVQGNFIHHITRFWYWERLYLLPRQRVNGKPILSVPFARHLKLILNQSNKILFHQPVWWLMTEILSSQNVEIGRIIAWGNPRQERLLDPIPSKKKLSTLTYACHHRYVGSVNMSIVIQARHECETQFENYIK